MAAQLSMPAHPGGVNGNGSHLLSGPDVARQANAQLPAKSLRSSEAAGPNAYVAGAVPADRLAAASSAQPAQQSSATRLADHDNKANAAGRPRHRRSNSTSSLYLTSTLDRPDLDGLLMSVSTMLHCQMMRDEEAPEKKKRQFPFFLEEYYTRKVVKTIPDPESIYHFLKEVFDVGEFHSECAIILLVYINRLIGLIDMPLTARNWKPVTITALILSQKVWDDNPLANADFSVLYPVLNLKQINSLEVRFLLLLQYKLTISVSLYARYYFELRTICEGEWSKFPSKSLTKQQAEKLEIRSLAMSQPLKFKAKGKPARQRSATLEDTYNHCSALCILG